MQKFSKEVEIKGQGKDFPEVCKFALKPNFFTKKTQIFVQFQSPSRAKVLFLLRLSYNCCPTHSYKIGLLMNVSFLLRRVFSQD